jgi:DNA-binding PadR family transcriptional regulator
MVRTMVLGLLKTHGIMSGYEIQQQMESAETDTWAYVQPPSIYHALKKLNAEGYVSLEAVEQTGYRTKALYAITPEGEKAYKEMLEKAFEKNSVVFPATLYTALTFWNELPPETVLKAVNKQITSIHDTIKLMKSGKERKAEMVGIEENVDLIYQNIFAQCDLQLDYLLSVKTFFEKRV